MRARAALLVMALALVAAGCEDQSQQLADAPPCYTTDTGFRFSYGRVPGEVVFVDRLADVPLAQRASARCIKQARPPDEAPRGGPTPTARRPPPVNAHTPAILDARAFPFAKVTVDDVVKGTTPLRPFKIKPGRHEVLLEWEDKTVRRVIEAKPGERVKLRVDMAKE